MADFTISPVDSAFGAGTPSRAIRISLTGGYPGSTATIAFSDNSAGGTVWPSSVSFGTTGSTEIDICYTPAINATGPITLTGTATGGITTSHSVTVPIGTATQFAADTFTDTSGTDLAGRTPTLGGAWVGEVSSGVTLLENGSNGVYGPGSSGSYAAAYIPTAPAVAGSYDVSADFELPATINATAWIIAETQPGPGLAGGILLRYANDASQQVGWALYNEINTFYFGDSGNPVLTPVTQPGLNHARIAVRTLNGNRTVFGLVNGTLLGGQGYTPSIGQPPAGYPGLGGGVGAGLTANQATSSVIQNFVGSNTDWSVASLTLSGPTSGTTGTPATFTVTASGLSGSDTVTPHVTGGTGLSPTSFSIASGSHTFTFTPPANGTYSISITDSLGASILDSPISFTASSGATTTHYDVSSFAAWLYGAWATSGSNKVAYGQSSGADFMISGTQATLTVAAGTGTLIHVSIDGATSTIPTPSGGVITLFTGDSDSAHRTHWWIDPSQVGGSFAIPLTAALSVTGASPAISANPSYGPSKTVIGSALTQSTFASDSTLGYGSGGTTPLGSDTARTAMIRFRASTPSLWVWAQGNTVWAYEIDGLRQGATHVTESVTPDTEFTLRQIASGLDVTTEHEYAVIAGDTSFLYAVMLGAGGSFSSSNVTQQGLYVQLGDSTTAADGCATAGEVPIDRSWSECYWIARQLGLMPWNCGHDGVGIAHSQTYQIYWGGDVASVPFTPSLVGILLGQNDKGLSSDGPVVSGYTTLLNDILAQWPTIPIVSYLLYDTPVEVGNTTALTTAIANDELSAIAAVNNPRIQVVSTFNLQTDQSWTLGNQTCDGIHLTLAGGQAFASYVLPGLNAIMGTQVAIPTFSPVAGTYTSTQTVVLATSTGSATIRYTLDGSTPTESHGTVYSTALSIAATTTVKAIGYKGGLADSPVATAVFTINSGGPVYPDPTNVAAGVTYGPTGADYTGTAPTPAEVAAAVWAYGDRTTTS